MSFLLNRRREMSCDDTHWAAISDRLRADPKDPDALFACAAYLAAGHRMTEAIESLDNLSEIAPEYPGLWRFKARLFREMGETELASMCWEKGSHDP